MLHEERGTRLSGEKSSIALAAPVPAVTKQELPTAPGAAGAGAHSTT